MAGGGTGTGDWRQKERLPSLALAGALRPGQESGKARVGKAVETALSLQRCSSTGLKPRC